MRIRSKRRRRMAVELFETRWLLSAVPAEVSTNIVSEDIFAERDGWQHIDIEHIPGIDGMLDAAGLRVRDMAFLRNELGHILARGHTSEVILDAVVTSFDTEVLAMPSALDHQISGMQSTGLTPPIALPDLSAITSLPGFPEEATLSVTPVYADGKSLGTSVTVWESTPAGEPPMAWEPPLVTLPEPPRNAERFDDSDLVQFIDIGEVTFYEQSESYVYSGQPAAKSTTPYRTENFLDLAGNRLQFNLDSWFDSFSETNQWLFQSTSANNFDSNANRSFNDQSLSQATFQIETASNSYNNETAFQPEFTEAVNVPSVEAVSNMVISDSFDMPTTIFDTPMVSSAVTPVPISNPTQTLIPAPGLTPTATSTPVRLDPPIDPIERQLPTVAKAKPHIEFEPIKPLLGPVLRVDLHDVPPESKWAPPTIVDPIVFIQDTLLFPPRADTIPNDPAIVSLNIPSPNISAETRKNVSDFLNDAEQTTESLFNDRKVQLPLDLESVELVSEHVDVGEASRQIRISPAEDEFIDIGDVEDPEYATAYYSAANIQNFLAAGYVQSQTFPSESPDQEVGTYGNTRRFESDEFRGASESVTNATTTAVTKQETVIPGDSITTATSPFASESGIAMAWQLPTGTSHSEFSWASQTDANSPREVTKSESTETTVSNPSTNVEFDNELLVLKTRLAKSSMVGSAVIIFFGATYFESRRGRERMEQADHTRICNRLRFDKLSR